MSPVGVHSGTIPTRFLTLLAHFIITVILLWDKVTYHQCIYYNNATTLLTNYYEGGKLPTMSTALRHTNGRLLPARVN